MYRYETHLHTSLVSACSRFTPEEIVEKYVRLGYRGLFVTDHFLNGNTSVPKELPWEERVSRYEEGYRAVKRAAEGALDVFFGIESSNQGADILVYGLDGSWYAAHPEIMELSPRDFCLSLRKAGALVVQAHPYREAFYLDRITLLPFAVDGVEAVNACEKDRSNGLARVLADAYGLKTTGGSDIHRKDQRELAGMEFETPLASSKDYAARVLRGEGNLFAITDPSV